MQALLNNLFGRLRATLFFGKISEHSPCCVFVFASDPELLGNPPSLSSFLPLINNMNELGVSKSWNYISLFLGGCPQIRIAAFWSVSWLSPVYGNYGLLPMTWQSRVFPVVPLRGSVSLAPSKMTRRSGTHSSMLKLAIRLHAVMLKWRIFLVGSIKETWAYHKLGMSYL